MFGATALRQKREREKREKLNRTVEQQVFPYIKPYGPRFDKNELPYFKHRETLRLLHEASEGEDKEEELEVEGVSSLIFVKIRFIRNVSDPTMLSPTLVDRIGNHYN